MPRIIFKCPHIKGGTSKAASHLGNMVEYIATREGVQEVEFNRVENYVEYIAKRPRAHGLFTGSKDPLVLSRIQKEVANHPGTVWLPIISLTREDAARLGYDNAESWRKLLSSYALEMAQAMKIPPEQFRWYAAFHDEKTHPHVHMVCYSADGKSGFLSENGIAKIKSGLAKQIFRHDLTEIYAKQTQQRDALNLESQKRLRQLIQQMQDGSLDNECVAQLMLELSRQLKKQEYQDACDRNIVEGVFGTGKTAYGLGRISVCLEQTTRCVIGVALLLMNLMKRLRSFFLALFLRFFYWASPLWDISCFIRGAE